MSIYNPTYEPLIEELQRTIERNRRIDKFLGRWVALEEKIEKMERIITALDPHPPLSQIRKTIGELGPIKSPPPKVEKEDSEDKTRNPLLDSCKPLATEEWVQKTFAEFLNQWEDIYFEMMEDIFGDVRDIKKVLGGNRWLTGQLPDELTDWPGCEFPVCSQCNSKAPRDAIRLNLGVNDAIFCRLECLKEWVALFPNVDAPKCTPTRRASPIWSAHLTCTKEKENE